jgi:predicted ribosome quality control (RQC) complex YloA/Tae2 family protein
MSLSAPEISQVLAELADVLLGGAIRRVHQQDPHTLLLRTARAILCLSCHPRASRLHLVERLGRRIAARDFCLLARRRLEGRRILAVHQPGGDRCVRLDFEGPEGYALCAELTGRHGNLLLLADGIILGSLLPNRSHKRALVPGNPYEGLLGAPDGDPPRSRFADAPSPSAAVVACYAPLLATWALEDLRQTLTRPLRRDLAGRRKLVANLRRDRASHEVALIGQRYGDLLLAQLGLVVRGSDAVDLPDLFYDGAGDPPRVTVPLDPRLSPADNAQRHYRRASKARRGLEALDRRLPEVEAEVARLEVALQTLDAADAEALERLAARARGPATAPTRGPGKAGRRGRADRRRDPHRTFEACGGEPIYVGRSAADNDRLTFTMARGRDAWLHARDVQGAHVVLRLDRGGDPPHESLLDAACLAKHYSDARDADSADVSWTWRKHVRRGGAPGQVYLGQSHTLRVGTDAARLQRLLSGRSATARLLRGLDGDAPPD